MANTLIELHSYELVEHSCGVFADFVATIADIVQTSAATFYDPPVFGSATCRGTISISKDEPLPKTEQQFRDLAEDVYDWQPIEDTY